MSGESRIFFEKLCWNYKDHCISFDSVIRSLSQTSLSFDTTHSTLIEKCVLFWRIIILGIWEWIFGTFSNNANFLDYINPNMFYQLYM